MMRVEVHDDKTGEVLAGPAEGVEGERLEPGRVLPTAGRQGDDVLLVEAAIEEMGYPLDSTSPYG